ncbi:MAG: CHAT domain-containing protein, partial [Vicinamibacteria bacterium]
MLSSKGAVLEEIASRQHLVAVQEGSESKEGLERLAAARQRLAWLWVRGPDPEHPESYLPLIAQAEAESERAEERLAVLSTEFRRGRARLRIGTDEVLASLPKNAALVEIVRYGRYQKGDADRALGSRKLTARPWDAAFVLRGVDRTLVWVDLGPADRNDDLISLWRDAVEPPPTWPDVRTTEAEERYREVSAALEREIWQPIAAAMGEVRTVFIAPDGPFHLVSFATLPVGLSAYLLEQGPTIHYLSSGRDLVRFGSPEPATSPRSARRHPLKNDRMLLVGAPDYDLDLSASGLQPASNTPALPSGSRASCGEFSKLTWSPLPQSQGELR